MNTRYFMGIDNGGSATKCVICAMDGGVVSTASTRIPMQRGNHGETDRSADDIWSANCQVIRKALEQSGLNPEEIACISMCGYGGGFAALDRDGNPAAPFAVSTDSRAEALLQSFVEDGTAERIRSRTHQDLWAGQPAMLLPWWKRQDLETYARFAHVLSIKDYIRYRLTGVLGSEATDASNTNLLDLQSGHFDGELFEILGIPEAKACFSYPLFRPGEVAGTVSQEAAEATGLCCGTPVATGLYDAAACCLAAGILDESRLCLIMGTWSICSRLQRVDQPITGGSTALCSFLPDYLFREEASPTSASNLDWFVEQVLADREIPGGDLYGYCNAQVAAQDPAESDLLFLPYLYGSNTVPGARACFLNLSSHHTTAHMLEAVYEGIVFSMMDHVRRLCGDTLPPAARLSGGPARSAVWSQMLCDLLGIPLEVLEAKETGALGSAMCAAAAVGAYPDLAAASGAMNRVRRVYTPDPVRHEVYRKKYALYQRAVKSLRCFYEPFQMGGACGNAS